MDFPAKPPESCPRDTNLETALGAANSITNTQRNRRDILVELIDAAALRSLTPDFRALARIPVRGIIATSRSDDPQFDFLSRFFAPSVGVDEDPVTGSAHCCLAPYWAAKLGKSELLARQISLRGGIIRTRLAPGRVILAGQAVTVLTGQLMST
jgi:predicted PhzF superfamily epimerase YddE/YHI9